MLNDTTHRAGYANSHEPAEANHGHQSDVSGSIGIRQNSLHLQRPANIFAMIQNQRHAQPAQEEFRDLQIRGEILERLTVLGLR
jgi:hypothetical protein